ncbi:MAG: L,D-transpeptidase family protein [Desulfobacterales bacterium]|nr:L,D-transpeptidase family protein [Desulfobacterales bacterium]
MIYKLKAQVFVLFVLFVILSMNMIPGICFSQNENSDRIGYINDENPDSETTGSINENSKPEITEDSNKGSEPEATGNTDENIIPEKFPDVLVPFDLDKNETEYILVVEKDTQQFFLYSYDGTFKEMYQFDCSTGKKYGPKTRRGDAKTPEGIYFFVKQFEDKELAPIYGTRAYPMDYPNIMDRIAERTGSAIWLHGINKTMKPMDSNGCVELENMNIDDIAKYITLNRTPIIVADRLTYEPLDSNAKENIKKSVQKIVSDWKTALEKGSYHDYLKVYDPDYLPDISWWPEWNKIRKTFRVSGQSLSLKLKKLLIVRHKKVYAALFEQVLKYSDRNLSVGTKKFFIKNNDGRLSVIGEEYQPAPKSGKQENPLIAASRIIKTRPPVAVASSEQPKTLKADEKGIKQMIQGWLKAWSSKNITEYGNYYASDFRSQGMNKRSWISYKNQLNKKYGYINVSMDKLTVQKGKKRHVVSFIQHYESSGFKAIGRKILILKREGGQWKIYRESWKKS